MHGGSHVHAGLVAAVVAVVCCLAPILLVATGVIGAGALTAAIYYGLFPVLIIAVGIAGYLLWRHRPRGDTRKH